jgi:hypothetical protein
MAVWAAAWTARSSCVERMQSSHMKGSETSHRELLPDQDPAAPRALERVSHGIVEVPEVRGGW